MWDPSELRIPIVQAPMAGGPATVELASAVCRAGGLGSLAAGYKTADGLAEQIDRLRAAVDAPFGVNVFVPHASPSLESIDAYRRELAVEAERRGVELPEPDPGDDDRWDDKIELLVRLAVPVVSFTFGVPPREVVAELHRAGTYVVDTVTSVAEARTAASLGVDALCVQGSAAGGHAGVHDPSGWPDATPLPELLTAVGEATGLPLIAAGGLATGEDIAVALRSGARMAQLGTAYLRTPESGARQAHKAALADPRFATTVVTRAFSGRPARALRNRFVDEHGESAPAGYPLVNQLTGPLRAAAAAAGDADGLNLWAGIGYRHSTPAPAGELTRRLWDSARTALGERGR